MKSMERARRILIGGVASLVLTTGLIHESPAQAAFAGAPGKIASSPFVTATARSTS
jgi:hypothetical protein